MIGVLAVMAILAAVITPNVLRSIERAAVRAEVDSLHSLGTLAITFLREKGIEPSAGAWNSTAELAPYCSLSPEDMLYNRRQQMPSNAALPEATLPVNANQLGYITRIYVPDPDPTTHRALFVSSMRFGIKLPANLLPTPTPTISPLDFDALWRTPDGTVPTIPGWGAWTNLADYLVIERVSFVFDRASVRAEADTLHNLGEQLKLYLRETGNLLNEANWNTGLINYLGLSPEDMLYNPRQQKPNNPALPEATKPVNANQLNYITRVYVPDPAPRPPTDPTPRRALFVSSMRFGIKLPANLLPTPMPTISPLAFDALWKTPDGTVPTIPGWGAWNNLADYLVIERVSFQSDLEDLPSHLTATGATVSYKLMSADGQTTLQSGQITAVKPADLTPNAHPNQRLNLYSDANWKILDYSYVFSTNGKNFGFDGTHWLPQ